MSDVVPRTLWCLVEGNSLPFRVRVTDPLSIDICDLKRLIRASATRGVLHNVDAHNLVLWQLRNPIAVKPSRDLAERIRKLGNTYTDFADELDELGDSFSDVFPHLEDHLHVIVQPPLAKVGRTNVVTLQRLVQVYNLFKSKGLWRSMLDAAKVAIAVSLGLRSVGKSVMDGSMTMKLVPERVTRWQTLMVPQPAQSHDACMTSELQLWCFIDLVHDSFTTKIIVPAPLDTDICDLKRLIHEDSKSTFHDIDANSLVLWKLRNPIAVKPSRDLAERIRKLGDTYADFADELDELVDSVSDVFSQPLRGYLYIIVTPRSAVQLGKRKRELMSDISSVLLENWTKPKATLPSPDHLGAYIKRPLQEDDKIPVTNRFMNKLTQQSDEPRTTCPVNDVESLFRESEDQEAGQIMSFVEHALSHSPPGGASTESAFVSFWDSNIRDLLDAAFSGKSIRDSNENTSPKLLRPDFGFLIGEVCAFRGEEKAPKYNGRHPKEELTYKLTWTYDPAPYVLGYYAIGPVVTLTAIGPKKDIKDLVSLDLSWKRNRIKNFIHLINLCSIIAAVRDVIGARHTEELVPIYREATGTIIKVGSSAVEKKYTREDRAQRVSHLQHIYNLLKCKNVQNVDSLTSSYEDDSSHVSVVYLEPKGIDTVPNQVSEVLDAVRCILDALSAMHTGSNPVFHRDIRWPNVVRSGSDSHNWFLIDWDDASTTPTFAANNHGPEVDLWAVGKLITDAAVFVSNIPATLLELGQKLVDGHTQTATEALQSLNQLSASYQVTLQPGSCP